jgi:hypothetical protein
MSHPFMKLTLRKVIIVSISAALASCLLSACSSPFLSSLTTHSGEAYFTDDFADVTTGWPQVEAAYGSMAYSDGKFKMTVTSPDGDLVAASRRAFLDVRLEVEAIKPAGSDNNRFGLVCRFKDTANFYMFIISSDGYFALAKVQDGSTSLLGQESMAYNSFIQPGSASNLLRMDCQDDTLAGWINGQLVAITQDRSFSEGKVGFIAGSFEPGAVEIRFDNLVAIKP